MLVSVFSKVLVANRGEIAVRIFRTLRELGIASVAVYSEADRGALHVRVADEAWLVGPGAPAESYLNQERIVQRALEAGAEAIHPGYGFLAENATFARTVEAAGLVWIGPPPEAIEAMGSKTEARGRMRAAGVPIIPGTTEPVESADEVGRLGDELGWPLAIKASAGGGGKGFRVVREGDDVERALETARREGEAYFSNPAVYVERYLEDPRHVEVQVLADAHGNVIHLGERDCTIQRRHQKLVEETPSPAVDGELRERIGADRGRCCAGGRIPIGGDDRGLARSGRRLLLHGDEHAHPGRAHRHGDGHGPRSRPRAGADRGRRAAMAAPGGRPSGRTRHRVPDQRRGSVRRLPARRRGGSWATGNPGGPGVRVDSGVEDGSEISPLYDPMIAKLIVLGVDREHARRRMLRALEEFRIGGVTTLLGFHRALLRHPCFVEGATCHGVVESEQLADAAQRLAEEAEQQWSQAATSTTPGLDGRVGSASRRSSSTAAASTSGCWCRKPRGPSSPNGGASGRRHGEAQPAAATP